MILYGDPAFAPFGRQASRLLCADLERDEDGSTRVRLDLKPLVVEAPGADFMHATARLMDYYSVRSEDIGVELKMELYTVLPLPAAVRGTPRLALKSARCGDQTVPAGEPQLVVEETPRGRFLHVRLPIAAPLLGGTWLTSLAVGGMTAELAGKN